MFPSSRTRLCAAFLASLCFAVLMPPLSAAIGTWTGSWPPVAGSYNISNDANVPVSATVQESP